jgi:hypothetical protein
MNGGKNLAVNRPEEWRKIERTEMRPSTRVRICALTDRVCDMTMRNALQMYASEGRIWQKKNKWNDIFLRMDSSRFTLRVKIYQSDGRRNTGRPRRRWLDSLWDRRVGLFSVSLGGVRLSPLGTSVSNWPKEPIPDVRWPVWSSRQNENLQGKPKYSEKTCTSGTLFTTDPTWPDLGPNPDRRGGKPATNRLSYGASIGDERANESVPWGSQYRPSSCSCGHLLGVERTDRSQWTSIPYSFCIICQSSHFNPL